MSKWLKLSTTQMEDCSLAFVCRPVREGWSSRSRCKTKELRPGMKWLFFDPLSASPNSSPTRSACVSDRECRNDEGRRPAAWLATSFFRKQSKHRQYARRQEEARPAGYPALIVQGHAAADRVKVGVGSSYAIVSSPAGTWTATVLCTHFAYLSQRKWDGSTLYPGYAWRLGPLARRRTSELTTSCELGLCPVGTLGTVLIVVLYPRPPRQTLGAPARSKGELVDAAPCLAENTKASNFWREKMTVGLAHLQPILSLIGGILILIMPQLLNYIVAIFLIVSGILGLGLIK